jgi:hypothetical protein
MTLYGYLLIRVMNMVTYSKVPQCIPGLSTIVTGAKLHVIHIENGDEMLALWSSHL